MTTRTVVDVANYQGVPNFQALKGDGVGGVIIKATEGSWEWTNPDFDAQYAAARAAGLAVGFYMFEHPGIADQSDAQLFLDRIAGHNPELGVWLDCEVSDGVAPAAMLPRLLADAQYIAQRYPMKTGFYTADWWWGPNTIGSVQAHMENWPLWVAGYTASLPQLPVPWKSPLLWQYTDQFAGLNMDASRFLGSDAQWSWLLTGKVSGPAPVPNQAWIAKIVGVQKAVHATADGVWGPDTERRAQNVRSFRIGPAAISNKALVFAFQKELGFPASQTDGAWGPYTQSHWVATVRAMQAAMGTPVTGAWDAATEFSFVALDPLI